MKKKNSTYVLYWLCLAMYLFYIFFFNISKYSNLPNNVLFQLQTKQTQAIKGKAVQDKITHKIPVSYFNDSVYYCFLSVGFLLAKLIICQIFWWLRVVLTGQSNGDNNNRTTKPWTETTKPVKMENYDTTETILCHNGESETVEWLRLQLSYEWIF